MLVGFSYCAHAHWESDGIKRTLVSMFRAMRPRINSILHVCRDLCVSSHRGINRSAVFVLVDRGTGRFGMDGWRERL